MVEGSLLEDLVAAPIRATDEPIRINPIKLVDKVIWLTR